MPDSRETDFSAIDIHEVLEQRRQIAIIWSADDVKQVRPDLTDDQAWEVLKLCDKRHDCDVGFTWSFIELIADELFPSRDQDAQGKGA